MKLKLGSLAWVLVAVAVVAGCSNPADGVAEAEVRETEGTTTEAALADGERFVFADGSTIGFTGSKVTGSHEGGFRGFDGEIVVVDGDPALSRVEVVIDTATIWSDNDKLTGHLKSADFFEVETYPTATFRSTAITPTAEGFEITGDLDLHGVTKQITFPATIEVSDDQVTAQAEFFILRYDFGIEYPGKPDDLIRDEVVIRLDLNAVPAEGSV